MPTSEGQVEDVWIEALDFLNLLVSWRVYTSFGIVNSSLNDCTSWIILETLPSAQDKDVKFDSEILIYNIPDDLRVCKGHLWGRNGAPPLDKECLSCIQPVVFFNVSAHGRSSFVGSAATGAYCTVAEQLKHTVNQNVPRNTFPAENSFLFKTVVDPLMPLCH